VKTGRIGDTLIELASAPSTNKTAAELLDLSKVRHGAVILAHEQTAGVGQRGRSWSSSPGLDLTFSVVVQPDGLRAAGQFVLAKATALAVSDVVAEAVPGEVRVKWPNDVLVGRAKVAGILIQAEVMGELVRDAIVGIGLNVNSVGFPAELAATSLLLAGGRMHDRMALLERLCRCLDHRLHQMAAAPAALDAAYLERLWMRGRWAPMELDGIPVELRPMDVDEAGRLIVEHVDGRVQALGLDRLRFAAR
jgi:BirA family biotin operon repressor/biotin-[acetyl-CoA-carboxylase] ligase